ncbi:MAG: GH3 auxin-responsive promoter family protein, partial [Deltaproteobacteria bacterium]|nr:GH3 auxin-responsive promoter family protein [Deltaproteobacteria bacterium]
PLEGVPRAVYRLADYETKYYLVLRAALDLKIALLGALNPSTLYLLCQKLTAWADRLADDVAQGTIRAPGPVPADIQARLDMRARPRPAVAERIRGSLARHGIVRPVDVWPALCGVLCWKGGSAPFYLDQLRPYLGDLPVMDYGYVATEGAFGITLDAGDGRGVVGVVGHVLEFVPESAQGSPAAPALGADQLEVGRRYAVIVTGSHGLYRYDINDIVEVVGTRYGLPEIRFVHKGGNMISITGEKVGEAHAVEAITAALRGCGVDAAGFALTARLADPPHYCVAVEPVIELADDRWCDLLTAFDRELQRVNLEYAAKRTSLRLGPPRLLLAPAGAFERLRAQRVAAGAPDAHVKIPHLWRDPTLLDQIGVRRELTLPGDPR